MDLLSRDGTYPPRAWWNLDGSIQHQIFQKEAAAYGMDLTNQSAARNVIQNCKSASTRRLARWLLELPWDCATATARRGMGSGVVLVLAPSLPTHGARRI